MPRVGSRWQTAVRPPSRENVSEIIEFVTGRWALWRGMLLQPVFVEARARQVAFMSNTLPHRRF